MRILHLIATLDIGGAEQNLGHLVTRMDRQAFQNMVVSMTDSGPIGEKIISGGIPVAALAMHKGLPDPRGMLRLHRIIRVFQPDIIQSWMYHANLLGLLFSFGHALIWNIRCSDMDLNRYGRIYRLTVQAGALLSGIPDTVVVNAHSGKTAHTRIGYHPRHWEIIPNGFDTEVFKPDPIARTAVRQELGLPSEAVAIGLIARLDPMKDHGNFFTAAGILQASYPDTHFVLVGRGLEMGNPQLQPFLQDLPRPHTVHLLGERQDVPRILSGLDIACSSSISEGLPNSIGEAMSAGLPCVATDAGDSRDLVDDTGIIVPRQAPQALALAISQLIDAGREHRSGLGRRARARISEHYDLAPTVRRYEDLYRDIKKSYSI